MRTAFNDNGSHRAGIIKGNIVIVYSFEVIQESRVMAR